LRVISQISKEEKLSNSKVVNILIEESLYARGLIKNIEKVISKMTNLPEEELNEIRIEELTDTYPKWYLHTLEEIRRGK
tara:strand:+ start:324 stop:560 length:237 start_codon:yes stop_codon:yes gene_type:complete